MDNESIPEVVILIPMSGWIVRHSLSCPLKDALPKNTWGRCPAPAVFLKFECRVSYIFVTSRSWFVGSFPSDQGERDPATQSAWAPRTISTQHLLSKVTKSKGGVDKISKEKCQGSNSSPKCHVERTECTKGENACIHVVTCVGKRR